MADGSSIINTSVSGLPLEQEDRAYAFCLGTQVLQNPSHSPRDGKLLFKISPNLFDATMGTNAVGTTAIGLATSANTSTLSRWAASGEIQDNGSGFGVYAVSFAERTGDSTLVNVCAAGQTRATVAKRRTTTAVSIGSDVLTITGHGYGTGDAVIITSGTPPIPLATGVTYYTIPSGVNGVRLAPSRTAAIAGSGIDITLDNGNITLESNDIFEVARDKLTGVVSLSRNGSSIHSFASGTTATLRPFFWTRESSNSVTIPVFKEIKVSGAT